MSEFSDRFRMLKDESGATLKELSEKLDITVPNLSYYMKAREPSYDILIKIADYFNVSTDWLLIPRLSFLTIGILFLHQ